MEAFRPQGTCSRQILFEVDDSGILADLKFLGGCTGALQALVRFAVGRPITEVISICDGIKCENETSCPEQLAIALKEYMLQRQREEMGLVEDTKPRGHPQILPTH